ncbi:MAG: S41 family peptidase [Chlorobi bacterium]|nr:S41 family peptidase [Chlorobiota bacterium]
MFKHKFSTVSVIILLVAGILVGMQINLFSDDNIYEQLNKFKDVLSYTKKYYVDEVDTKKLVASAIRGMLKDLDPHSVYIPPKQLEKIQEDFRGSFEGIGIEFNILHDTLTVVTPIFGGPSEKVGIQAGDKIIAIDGEECIGITNQEVQKKLRGPKGTKVRVTIVRIGVPNPLEFEITRDKIPLYSVDAAFITDDDVGYVTINRFSQTTSQELIQALRKLRSTGMKKLVLDLRFNPGGYLEQAFRVSDQFLKAGQKIVFTKGRRPEFDDTFLATGRGEFQTIPLIILVSNSSASASEIVAGAIQDHDRGLIVGETTFGKGLVQRQFELSDGSAFRLTTARYYTPSGRLIQRPYEGQTPQEYYRAAYRHAEKDMKNIFHKAESDSTRPVFETDGGRKVYGDGGITPDYIVPSGKLQEYAAKGRQFVYEFVRGYMDNARPPFPKRYARNEAVRFINEFTVSDALLQEYVKFLETKDIPFNEEQFNTDKKYIAALLKAQIARNLFGNEGYFRAMLAVDKQFKKAVELFPEAKKIAGLN